MLRQKVILKLPYFLNSILHETSLRLKIYKDQASVVSHYRLIKLIVVRGLNKGQMSWEDFLGNPQAPLESEAPIGDSGDALLNNEQP